MKIISVNFVKSASQSKHYPKSYLPEIAFLGRSNVGKSSCINSILNRKGLVKTSSTPGKTRLINFFCINNSFMFVDLPGYGYAKVPAAIKESWKDMIETYLSTRKQLVGAVLLADIRHNPNPKDKMMVDFLSYLSLKTVIIGTKADKIPKYKKKVQSKAILESLSPDNKLGIIIFSKKTGEGKKEILKIIEKWTRQKQTKEKS